MRDRKLLIVAMANSVHVANWLRMIVRDGPRIFLLSPYVAEPLNTFPSAPVRSATEAEACPPDTVGILEPPADVTKEAMKQDAARGYTPWAPDWMGARVRSPGELAWALDIVKPDFVHSMEIQFAGYLCAEAKSLRGDGFPPWLLSNWGSDIYLYKKQRGHAERLRGIARIIDYYLPECRRDLGEVERLGFTGTAFDPVPASGGFDFAAYSDLLDAPPPSRRRSILVKGYHGWAGRGLTAISAIRLAERHLHEYDIHVTLGGPDVIKAAKRLAADTGLRIACDNYLPDHRQALARMAEARIAMGISISDGISTSLLEAMALGAFPVQSNTACVDEWTEDGKTAFIVSPYDSREIAERLIAAATDDAMVDAAAATNRATIERRWEVGGVGATVLDYYRRILA